MIMSDSWLTTLITDTPQEGVAVLKQLRPEYANSADSLTAASQVIAINFQTVAAANNYWRK